MTIEYYDHNDQISPQCLCEHPAYSHIFWWFSLWKCSQKNCPCLIFREVK